MMEERKRAVSELSTSTPRERRVLRTIKRDGGECVWCRRSLEFGDSQLTIDHVLPKGSGGPAWPENEVLACYKCNHRRGSTPPAMFLEECEERGLDCNRDLIVHCLVQLERQIAIRGGCERGRPNLTQQLRRLGKSRN